MATFGVDAGIHRFYVNKLLKLFEFCRNAIEKKERKKQLKRLRSVDRSDSSSDDEDIKVNKCISNGDAIFENNVISSPEKFYPLDDKDDHEFSLTDIFEFLKKGVESIVDDEVTKRFSAEELQTWNLMTRTNRKYHFVSLRLTLIWSIGFLIRFFVLFPIRIVIFTIGLLYLIFSCAFVGLLPEGPLKRKVYSQVSVLAFRVLARSVSAIITWHNQQYKPKNGSLCVANHTSPVDAVFLHTDNAYALVGQLHGGILGLIQRSLNKATSHVFFNRFEVRDRQLVTARIRAHVEDDTKLPILLFPEGTCINNSAVMMFKKGSFEVADVVYPVAVKYNKIFGDSFWDSSKYGFFTYLLMIMTSWAIVLDVWYLPPMTREKDETAVDFAYRVKAAIAKQGGLIDLEWDGQLKRQPVKPDLLAQVQNKYSRKISKKEVNSE